MISTPWIKYYLIFLTFRAGELINIWQLSSPVTIIPREKHKKCKILVVDKQAQLKNHTNTEAGYLSSENGSKITENLDAK